MADTAEATAPTEEEPADEGAALPSPSPFKKLYRELGATVFSALPFMASKKSWDYFAGCYEASKSSAEEPANEFLASQESFPFMKLSPELRAMVLKELLIMSGSIRWDYFARCYSGSTRGKTPVKQAPFCQVFLVSKALYREAVPIYFGCNLFSFENLDRFESFSCAIGPDARWQLRKVAVDYAGYAPARAVKSLVRCMGLKELEVNVHWWSWSKCPGSGSPPQLYGHKDFLRIRGLEQLLVNVDQYNRNRDPAVQLYWPEFMKTLEVLKQPRDPRTLKRQEAKDFPPQKATRTVFGKANVVTRSERKMLHEQSPQ
ncbi:MAG: hypothetical protein Q9191_007094 [Dirinaria sp. TL-2023a]